MHPAVGKLAFVVLLVLNGVLWSHSRYSLTGQRLPGLLARRSVDPFHVLAYGDQESECAPLSVPQDQQCAHVHAACPRPDTFLSIPYLHAYFCASPGARPVAFAGLLLLLVFLFSTLGISASDFFCPNLQTLAELLHLDEGVAGVTLLALGNGAPDLFATIAAVRAGTGALAVGELLGAASFIVSVVVGAMCIVRPFAVPRGPFLRDVGFFTTAVALLLYILHDGKVRGYEAGALITLYVVYVLTVVVGSWWERRQAHRRASEALARGEYGEDEPFEGSYSYAERYQDDPSPPQRPSLSVSSLQRSRTYSTPGPPRLGIDTTLPPHTYSRSPSPAHVGQMPSFSLVGALEFRQVVAALQAQAAGAALGAFETPATPYAGGHYHRHSFPRPRSPRAALPTHARMHTEPHEEDPWQASLGPGVPLDDRSPRASRHPLPQLDGRLAPGLARHASDGGARTPLPTFERTPASPLSDASGSEGPGDTDVDTDVDGDGDGGAPRGPRGALARAAAHTAHVLFPTLQGLRHKSALGALASVLAAPAVLALTATLPVVVRGAAHGDGGEKRAPPPEARLVDFEEEGEARALVAEDAESDAGEFAFNRWLMAAQCTLGPLFCVAVLFAGVKHEGWLLAATAVAGAAVAVLVAVFADRGDSPAARMARCFMGFIVAVVWIMAIADEVVNVLKTFGFIFGLSDALIGLTVFAVGNSLADLVANTSVAAVAPVMGFAACFGGPMLNILLGVGGSGAWAARAGTPLTLHFSATLRVSACGLLALLVATLVWVPLNGFVLTRRWGVFLIVCYVVIMTANVAVELATR